MAEMKTTIRIVMLEAGGFVIAEELSTGDFDAIRAVSTIDEACGFVQSQFREWHKDAQRLKAIEYEDGESNVRALPSRFWWRRAQ